MITRKKAESAKIRKDKIRAFSELNILTRRYFLIYLFNNFVDEPSRQYFLIYERHTMYIRTQSVVFKDPISNEILIVWLLP